MNLSHTTRYKKLLPDNYTENQIKTVAYQMWEEAGKPQGNSDYFWYKAIGFLVSIGVLPHEPGTF